MSASPAAPNRGDTATDTDIPPQVVTKAADSSGSCPSSTSSSSPSSSSFTSSSSLAVAPPSSAPSSSVTPVNRVARVSVRSGSVVTRSVASAAPPAGPERDDTLNIISWNVNGIRSVSMRENSMLSLFAHYRADIFCLQETKLSSWQDWHQHTHNVIVPGYDSFWSFSRKKKGWSGVATYVRKGLTVNAIEDLGDPHLDGEGRIVQTDHGKFILLNVYYPNGGSGAERQTYKMQFYTAFERHVRRLLAAGRHCIIVGDVNTAHRPIDMFDPQRFCNSSGFLPEERAWMDGIIRTDVNVHVVEQIKTLETTRQQPNGKGGEEQQVIGSADAASASATVSSIAANPVPPAQTQTQTEDYDPTFLQPQPPPFPDIASLLLKPDAPPLIDSFCYFHPYRSL